MAEVPQPTSAFPPSVMPQQPKIERLIGPTGDIVLQFNGEPSLEAYQFLEDYIKLRKTVLKSSGQKTES